MVVSNSGVLFVRSVALAAVVQLSGCATYYNHYGSFTAENSAGAVREYLLSWQTAEYPSWWLQSDYSTPISLQSQCSERVIKFYDHTQEPAQAACATDSRGVAWCGEIGQDVTMEGSPASGADQLCGWIADAKTGNQPIPQLGSQLEVNIQCRPVRETQGTGDKKQVLSYLKMSTVPYAVATKKVERYSSEDIPIKLDTKICKVEDK